MPGNGEGPGVTNPGPTSTLTALADDHRQATRGVTQDPALRWLVDELEAAAEVIHAAVLTARAGHRPAVHVRRAAVRLAALDAALGDEAPR